MPDIAPARSQLDYQEMAYAKEVVAYNNLIVRGAVRPQLVDKFAKAAEAFNNAVSSKPIYLAKLFVCNSRFNCCIFIFRK